jgi:hypothetical protein
MRIWSFSVEWMNDRFTPHAQVAAGPGPGRRRAASRALSTDSATREERGQRHAGTVGDATTRVPRAAGSATQVPRVREVLVYENT